MLLELGQLLWTDDWHFCCVSGYNKYSDDGDMTVKWTILTAKDWIFYNIIPSIQAIAFLPELEQLTPRCRHKLYLIHSGADEDDSAFTAGYFEFLVLPESSCYALDNNFWI